MYTIVYRLEFIKNYCESNEFDSESVEHNVIKNLINQKNL